MESAFQNEYTDRPRLIRSRDSVELVLLPGEQFQDSIEIRAEDGRKIQGVATSDNRRIMLAENSFSGNVCSLTFGIDTKGLSAGDRVRGSIVIISSLAEDQIPVSVRIVRKTGGEAEEKIRDLNGFAALCQKSMREGFQLFTDSSFEDLLNGEDAQYRALCRGMTSGPVTYQRLEEFLVAAGKKEPLTYTLDTEEKSYFSVSSRGQDSVVIRKNTWGYEQLDITVTDEFIEVPKKRILTDDFVGGEFTLPFSINPDRLGSGVRSGRIEIRGVRQTLSVKVTASKKSEGSLVPDLFEKQQRLKLYRAFLAHLENGTDIREFSAGAEVLLRELRLADASSAEYLLFEAYLAWKKGETTHALEFLWPVRDGSVRLKNTDEECVYLFLAKATTLLPDEQMNILPKLRAAYRNNPEDYLLLCLTGMEEGQKQSPEERYILLEQCFEFGCNSPFLFREALELIRRNNTIFRKLTLFEVRILQYAARRGLLDASLAGRLAFLSHNLKRFDPAVYRLLVSCYERFGTEELLEAVCHIIVRGQPIRREYHRYYELAILHNLRITQVYEYYMETADENAEERFPMPVLMYFSTNDTLGVRRRALLYASIVLHKDDDPSVYKMYRTRIRNFAADALEKGLISENIAILYRHFFAHPSDGRSATLLSRVLFTHRLTTDAKNVRRVIVCYEGIAKEESFPLESGVACINYYSDDACVLFEDARRRRIASGIRFELKPLLNIRESLGSCVKQNVRNTGLLLAVCGSKPHRMEVRPENVDSYRMAESVEDFSDRYRNAIRRKIVDYYLTRPEDFSRISFVRSMDPLLYAEADKAGTVLLLMEEGMFSEAFRVLFEYGYENIAPGLLLQLANRMILQRDGAYDEELLYMTSFVYRSGKYSDDMLCYLRNYFDGPVTELCDLWGKLKGFQLDTFRLEEKILRQSVFANAFPDNSDEILKDYLKEQGNRSVACAFLSHLCRAHLLNGHPMSDRMFRMMERFFETGTQFSTGMKLALLLDYSGKERLDANQMRLAEQFLASLDEKDIRFGYFKKLPQTLIEKYQIEDKTFIEKRLRPGMDVTIHYRVTRPSGEDGPWMHQPMKDLYHGLYVRELLLFYGEKVTWYLTVSEGKETEKSEENVLTVTDIDTIGNTRFRLLNRMLKADADGNRKERDRAMARYIRQETYVESFLQPM
ncbi:MAG: DUF5717 family protein [Bilifractor sp.]|jgi:hypothetical protein